MIEELEIITLTRTEIENDEDFKTSYKFADKNDAIFKIKNKYYETTEKKYTCEECIYLHKPECQDYIVDMNKKEIYYICSFVARLIFIETTDKRKILTERLKENVYEIKHLKVKDE